MDPILAISSVAAFVGLLFAIWLYRIEPGALAARLLGAGLLLLAVETLLAGLSASALLPEQMQAWQRFRLLAASLIPGVWLSFSLVYARTNHAEFLRRWRLPLILLLLLTPATLLGWGHLVTGVTLAEGRLYWPLTLGPMAILVRLAGLVGAAFIVMNLEQTFREARGMTRWRIKYVLAGLLTIFVLRIFFDGQALLFREWSPSFEPILALSLVVGCLLMLRSLRRLPHLHVDLYVSTTVVFGSVAAILIAGYLLLIAAAAQVWRHGAWQAAGLVAATAIVFGLALLVVLLLSDHARVRARQLLARHLRRPSFDYRQLWHDFAQETRQAMHVEEVAEAVTSLVSNTFEALSVSCWLLTTPRTLQLVASSDGVGHRKGARPCIETAEEALTLWQKMEAPIDLDLSRADWAETLRQFHPTRFSEGGHRFCMPVKDPHTMFGLLIVGDRVGGAVFTAEELDLLRMLADQTAVRMETVRLAENLLAAKQWEAFQTMSAFLVHDLKNTASSLSLTLQNLGAHFDDPTFRKDAERSISSGVRRMNELIRRLTDLRETPPLHLRTIDLSSWLHDQAEQFAPSNGGSVEFENGPPLPVRLDAEQFQTVLTNLICNAREASPDGTPIQVRTEAAAGWARLSVIDRGSGMETEFVAERLFRPFETTKKQGMGIGLFQTRRVVEAHGGRIEVDSRPGEGSTFRVLLPLEESL